MIKFTIYFSMLILLFAEGNNMNTVVNFPSDPGPIKDCKWENIALQGKVQFVKSFPDIKIKIVDHFPDIKVKYVEAFPDECGEWQIVESFPDFRVELVESFPDIRIKLVDQFPGVN